MYRVPDRPPQGKWAAYLHRHRKQRDWSQQQAFEALREVLRLGPKSRASYIKLDMGDRSPREWEEQKLVEYFGDAPADDEAPPLAAPVTLVDALREQNDLLRRQAEAAERTAAATEQLVTALGARLDQMERSRRAELEVLAAELGRILFQGQNGSARSESSSETHQEGRA